MIHCFNDISYSGPGLCPALIRGVGSNGVDTLQKDLLPLFVWFVEGEEKALAFSSPSK